MFSVGTQRTLARVSWASATQTLACAAATMSGLASESRSAVARLIGNLTSPGTSCAGSRSAVEARSPEGVVVGAGRWFGGAGGRGGVLGAVEPGGDGGRPRQQEPARARHRGVGRRRQ